MEPEFNLILEYETTSGLRYNRFTRRLSRQPNNGHRTRVRAAGGRFQSRSAGSDPKTDRQTGTAEFIQVGPEHRNFRLRHHARTARQVMIEALLAEMSGVRIEDVTIFIATGTHRRNTTQEIEKMIGADLARTCRVICHDARDAKSLVYVGNTSTGVRILLNQEWLASEFKITT